MRPLQKVFCRDGIVNYQAISMELGLHKPSLDMINPRQKFLERVKGIRKLVRLHHL